MEIIQARKSEDLNDMFFRRKSLFSSAMDVSKVSYMVSPSKIQIVGLPQQRLTPLRLVDDNQEHSDQNGTWYLVFLSSLVPDEDLLSSLPLEALSVLLVFVAEDLGTLSLVSKKLENIVKSTTQFLLRHALRADVLFDLCGKNPVLLHTFLNKCDASGRTDLHKAQVLLAARFPKYLDEDAYERFWQSTIEPIAGDETACRDITEDDETSSHTDAWLLFLHHQELRKPHLNFEIRKIRGIFSRTMIDIFFQSTSHHLLLVMFSLSCPRASTLFNYAKFITEFPDLQSHLPSLVCIILSMLIFQVLHNPRFFKVVIQSQRDFINFVHDFPAHSEQLLDHVRLTILPAYF